MASKTSKNPFSDLGAEPVDLPVESEDYSDLGAVPVEAPEEESAVAGDYSDLGAEPVETEEKKPGFFEGIYEGFQKRAAADRQAQEAAAAQPPPPSAAEELQEREVEIRQSPAKRKGFQGLVDSLKKFYKPGDTSPPEVARAQLIQELSEEFQLEPSYVQKNFDELARKKAESTGVLTQPTNEEVLNAIMLGTIPMSAAIAGPMAIAKGIAGYTAIKEGAERVVLPAAKIIAQKLSGEPVQYEVTKLKELLPDVGPLHDIADLAEFVIYGVASHKAGKFLESPKVAAELAGIRFRILKTLGVKQPTELVPLSDAQIQEAFGDQAWKYLSKEGLAKWKTEELAKRGAGSAAPGERPVEVKVEGPAAEAPAPVAPEVIKELGAEPVAPTKAPNKEPIKFKTEKEFVDYHVTGGISSSAYERYGKRGGLDFFGTVESNPVLLKTQDFGGEKIEFRKTRDEDQGIAAFNSKGEVIGGASNEFGADGIWIVDDYQKRGIGTELLYEFRKQFKPERKIGQVTPSGYNMVRAYYRRLKAEDPTETPAKKPVSVEESSASELLPGEKPISSAVIVKGQVFTGSYHLAALEDAVKKGVITEQELEKLWGSRKQKKKSAGLEPIDLDLQITNKGRLFKSSDLILNLDKRAHELKPGATEIKPNAPSKLPKGKKLRTYEPDDTTAIAGVKADIGSMEALKRTRIVDPDLPVGEDTTHITTGYVPEYLKNIGVTKARDLPILEKAAKNEPLTDAQHERVVDLIGRWYNEQERIYGKSIEEAKRQLSQSEAEEALRLADQAEPPLEEEGGILQTPRGGGAAQGPGGSGDVEFPFGENAPKLFLKYGSKTYPVNSLKDASDKWQDIRDRAMKEGLGPRDMENTPLVVDEAGKTQAEISWNGNIIESKPRTEKVAGGGKQYVSPDLAGQAKMPESGLKAKAPQKEEPLGELKGAGRPKEKQQEFGGTPSGEAFSAPPLWRKTEAGHEATINGTRYLLRRAIGPNEELKNEWDVIDKSDPDFVIDRWPTLEVAKKKTQGYKSSPSGEAFSAPSSKHSSWQPKPLPAEKIAKLHKFFGGMEYVRAMEMPELVRLARDLFGAPPQVVKATGSALGRFISARGRKQSLIKLVAEIFKDPELAAGIIAHEIGHGVDWLPDYTLKRGNVLGRVASLHEYRKEVLPEEPGGTGDLTDKDRARLRRMAEKKVGVPEEVTTEFDPNAVLSIFNTIEGGEKNPELSAYIKGLDTAEKKSIIKAAMVAARKGEMITIKEVKKFNTDFAANREAVRKEYEDLVKAEIKKRKLFQDEVMREELQKLTTWWHPFDPAASPPSYVKYRYSGRELYAEFISVLLNAPAKAQELAPTFFKAFFNYLDSKPAVKQNFFEIQELLTDPAKALARRESDIVKMFERSRDQFANLLTQKTAAQKSLRFLLKYHFVDRNAAVLEARNKVAKKTPINPEDDPKYLLEENSMMGAFVKSYLDDFDVIYHDIRKAGLDFDKDFGQYLFLKRVQADRAEMANPLGQNPQTAARQLENMKERLGTPAFNKLEGFVTRTRGWFKEINDLLKEDVLTPQQIAMVDANNDYAPFRVTKYLKEYASARFHAQIGTLGDIENPAASLVLKGVAMLRLYKRNLIEKNTVNFLLDNSFADRAVVKTFDGKVHVREQDGVEILKWRERGRWRAAYVDPYIADSFKYDDSGVLQSVGEVFGKILLNNALFRPVYITFNLGFQSFNLVKDFSRFWKNTPGLTFAKAVKSYIKAAPSAVRRVKGELDPVIQALEREGALNISMNDMIMGQNDEDTEIDALLSKYGMRTPEGKPHPILRPIVAILKAIKFGGDVIETIPKVAGYHALAKMNATERAQYIRNYIGTPNWKRKGKMAPIYNNVFLFSNIIKEGIRSDTEAAFKNPKTRSGYWWKTIKIGILPKILMALGAAGVFGKAIKDNYEKQTEYDKTNYITIPLGEDERGKAIYLRIPQDETTRLVSGLFWKTLSREEPQDILAFTAGQIPSPAPALEMMVNWGEYLTGGTPRDSFRNQEILTRDEAAAGGMEALEPMIRWTMNQTGLVHMDIRDRLRDETLLEKSVAFTPIINRWIRITDYGKVESLRETMRDQAGVEAKARLTEKEGIRKAIREGKTAREAARDVPYAERNEFIKKFEAERIRPKLDTTAQALRSAGSNEQKHAVLAEAEEEFETVLDYRRELLKYHKEKLISLPVLNEAVKRYKDRKAARHD